MTKGMFYYWIDDSPSRESNAASFNDFLDSKGCNSGYEFVSVEQQDPIRVMEATFEENPSIIPDLFIVDQFFEGTSGIVSRGSSLVEIIREKYKDCPIVCFTAEENYDKFDTHRKSLFDDVIYESDRDINNVWEDMLVLVNGYKKIIDAEVKNLDGIVQLLSCTDSEREDLLDLVPQELAQGEMKVMHISQWILNQLIYPPGLLLNREWTASLVGLNMEAFVKVESLFESAKYKGVYTSKLNERWWRGQVIKLVYDKASEIKGSTSWEVGHCLPDISSADFSVCIKCGKVFPEAMGFLTQDHHKFRDCKPMHIACSSHDSRFLERPYYEDIRLQDDD